MVSNTNNAHDHDHVIIMKCLLQYLCWVCIMAMELLHDYVGQLDLWYCSQATSLSVIFYRSNISQTSCSSLHEFKHSELLAWIQALRITNHKNSFHMMNKEGLYRVKAIILIQVMIEMSRIRFTTQWCVVLFCITWSCPLGGGHTELKITIWNWLTIP